MHNNIKRIEDLLRNDKTFESVTTIVAFYELCSKIDSIVKRGEDYRIEHYHRYAKSLTFKRHKDEDVPYNAQRLQFYNRKYYVYL